MADGTGFQHQGLCRQIRRVERPTVIGASLPGQRIRLVDGRDAYQGSGEGLFAVIAHGPGEDFVSLEFLGRDGGVWLAAPAVAATPGLPWAATSAAGLSELQTTSAPSPLTRTPSKTRSPSRDGLQHASRPRSRLGKKADLMGGRRSSWATLPAYPSNARAPVGLIYGIRWTVQAATWLRRELHYPAIPGRRGVRGHAPRSVHSDPHPAPLAHPRPAHREGLCLQ